MYGINYPVTWNFIRNTSYANWHTKMESYSVPIRQPRSLSEQDQKQPIPLLSPDPTSTSLETAINERLSCRKFSASSLDPENLAQILKFSYGNLGTVKIMGADQFERPVPSAGGRYPLRVHAFVLNVKDVDPGIYQYSVQDHCLNFLDAVPSREDIVNLFMGQKYLMNANVILILSAVLEKMLSRYGERGFRYILLEAGHVAQNINLLAAALGLGSLNLGGFYDDHLSSILGLDFGAEVPLYGIAVGRMAATNRTEIRNLDFNSIETG